MGLGGMAVVTFFMLPQATESLWWWIGEVGGTLLLITGALVHGHLKWRRRQKFKKMVKDAGLEGRRVVDLGGNAIGVVPDGPAEWDKLRTRRG
jgi:hypothetical protein